MSTDYGISGFIPPDSKWKAMKSIYDACKKAGVSLPKEVIEFFNGELPDDNGREVNLANITNEIHKEGMHGWELEIERIPKNVKIIRFYASF